MQGMAISGAVFFWAAMAWGQTPAGAFSSAAAQQALINKYCVGCHNDKLKSGGLSLAQLEQTLFAGHVGDGAEEWEKVILKLRSGMMPPPGVPRPDAATVKSFAGSLEEAIDRSSAAHPNRKRPPRHSTVSTGPSMPTSVRELLNLEFDAPSLFACR